MATTRLTIYLLKDISKEDEAIFGDAKPTKMLLDKGSKLHGSFYYASRPASAPSWLTFVQPLLASAPRSLTSSSSSGLLILKVNKRFFAITFGYGRGFLDPSKIEHQFGLRVALNRIDPSQIRSLDTKTFEDMVVTRNIQTSKSSELPSFGVDVSRDILRAVTGEPRNKSFARRLSGSDALVANLEIDPVDLAKLCKELLKAFGESSYKTNFEWIDHLKLISDVDTIGALNGQLETQLRKNDTSSTHLAMPDAIDWGDIDAFKISGTRKHEYDDLDLESYLTLLGTERNNITITNLKSRHISVRFSRANDFESRWSVYQCLVSEQRLDDNLHVLVDGRWFVVSASLVNEVDGYVTSLSTSKAPLIESQFGEKEPDYNRRLAASSPSTLLLLDAKIKRPGGATSGIEICDVLTSKGEFIHIKRRSRSSTLSHLFAQGSVSATTFIGDGHFRDEIRKLVRKNTKGAATAQWLSLIPESGKAVSRSKYSVSFVIIANSSATTCDWLPFFSRLNLMQCGRQLQNLGFKVSVTRVAIEA